MNFNDIKENIKMRKMQAELQKQMEQIFYTLDKQGLKVVVRGDRRVEKIEINGIEDKKLKDTINDAQKEVMKKVEKQMRGQLAELGLGN